MDQEQVPLKFEKIDASTLLKGDVVLHQGQLWQCASKHMQLFINLQTRSQQYIKNPELLRVSKLQLLPREWKVNENKITLKGQQLGLGPMHEVQIDGMKTFEQMEVIKSEMAKGRRIQYKVVLCETTAPKRYLLVAIQFL